MNLAVVIPAAHKPGMTQRAKDLATTNATLPDTKVYVWDNGLGWGDLGNSYNVGNYPVFHRSGEQVEASLILFIHNDLYIWEEGYDERLVECFTEDERLGLVGFVGSFEFDIAGGRGAQSWMNFQGREGGSHWSEHASIHETGFKAAANLDGCALCFRRTALLECPIKLDFPPHHFYDRLFCAQMLERGWHVGYLGVECDHLNGQTANGHRGYYELAASWCKANNAVRTDSPDHDVYLEAERQFLAEYLERKRFIPLRVGPDHVIYHTHPMGGPHGT